MPNVLRGHYSCNCRCITLSSHNFEHNHTACQNKLHPVENCISPAAHKTHQNIIQMTSFVLPHETEFSITEDTETLLVEVNQCKCPRVYMYSVQVIIEMMQEINELRCHMSDQNRSVNIWAATFTVVWAKLDTLYVWYFIYWGRSN